MRRVHPFSWLALLGLGLALGFVQMARVEKANWQSLGSGKLASLEVERTLYRTPRSGYFWVHLRVHNRGQKPMGLDFPDGRGFCPNQVGWEFSPERSAIDERMPMEPAFGAREQNSLRRRLFKSGLRSVKAGGTFDFYAPFNGFSDAQKELQEQRRLNHNPPFLILSIRGVLDATDGARIERLSNLAFRKTGGTVIVDSDVALRAPLKWKPVPGGAVLMKP